MYQYGTFYDTISKLLKKIYWMYIKITFYNIKCTKKKGKNLLFDVSATFFVLIIKLESSL